MQSSGQQSIFAHANSFYNAKHSRKNMAEHMSEKRKA